MPLRSLVVELPAELYALLAGRAAELGLPHPSALAARYVRERLEPRPPTRLDRERRLRALERETRAVSAAPAESSPPPGRNRHERP
jgi:hypothetical protein